MTLRELAAALGAFLDDQPDGTRVVAVCPPALRERVAAAIDVLDPDDDLVEVRPSDAVPAGDVYLMRAPEERIEITDPILDYRPSPLVASRALWWLESETLVALPRYVARLGALS